MGTPQKPPCRAFVLVFCMTMEMIKLRKNNFQFYQFPMQIILVGLTRVWLGSEMSGLMHYGLTGGWVQKFKASYLLCFLYSALVFKAKGRCDHHAFPLG